MSIVYAIWSGIGTVLVAVIGFFIIQRDYRRTYQNKNLFFPFAQSFISFGFIACYLFMAINYFCLRVKCKLSRPPPRLVLVRIRALFGYCLEN